MVNQKNFPDMRKKTSDCHDKNFTHITQYIKDAQTSHKKDLNQAQSDTHLPPVTRPIPPVHLWHPQQCGKMDLIIKANGEWWHEGSKIQRQSLIDLFSSVLWKEQEQFYLKTPVEQIEITVEDEPLLVNQVNQIEQNGLTYIQLMTTTQDVVVVDEQHPIFMKTIHHPHGQTEQRPYVHVRYGLNALIQRSCFYHLVELGELLQNEQGQTILQLQSGEFRLHFNS
ncbi:MAG: DUF1285 domain-containing protein [Acinetobacter sp.]